MSALHSGNTLSHPYAAFDIVTIAASWGGVAVLSHLLSALPADFAAPIVVVQHLNPKHPSQLDAVLGQRTRLAVCWAKDSVALSPGTVFLAPPDCHVRVTLGRTLTLWQGPKVNFTRPAADPLFESVAAVSGERDWRGSDWIGAGRCAWCTSDQRSGWPRAGSRPGNCASPKYACRRDRQQLRRFLAPALHAGQRPYESGDGAGRGCSF